MSAAGELGLAALAGAGFASAALAAAWAGRAEMRARLAEDLLASRERRASMSSTVNAYSYRAAKRTIASVNPSLRHSLFPGRSATNLASLP